MNVILKKVLRKIICVYLKNRGFKKYMVWYFSGLIVEDILCSNTTLSDKIWSYKRGFLSTRIANYKLNNDNYKDYLSDYDYYRMYPLNGYEKVWIDDKLTTKYIFSRFDEFLPAYYYFIDKGQVIGLHNAESGKRTVTDVITKLKDVKILAFKKEATYGGHGFYKVEYIDNNIIINGRKINEEEFIQFLNSLEDYLVMEYIIAHKEIRKYYSGATGVLRVMVVNENEPKIANAYIRVGSSMSGSIDAYTGSISSVVDIDTGKYGDSWMHDGFDFIKVSEHPDSRIPFEGVIPRWEYVKEKLLAMAMYTPKLIYLGFDVCVTDDGFKIYEINSHQGIELYQLSYPLLKNNPASEFFKQHIK